MQSLVATPGPAVQVRVHWVSAIVSIVFAINLIAMPFYFYLHMPVVLEELSEDNSTLESTDVAHALTMQSRYNGTGGGFYFTDKYNGAVVLRSDISTNLLYRCDFKSAVLSRIQGAVFFSRSVESVALDFACGNGTDPMLLLWKHYYFGVHVANSILWSAQESDARTLVYLIEPLNRSLPWNVLEFLGRVVLSIYIAHQCWRYFYSPVYQLFVNLGKNSQGKACCNVDIVLGEPTSLVVSNGWIVLAFTLDLLLHPGTMGVATLRLIQPYDAWGGFLGTLYFGRLVWFSYGALWLWNFAKRSAISPVSCTMCAWITTILGVVLTKVDFIWNYALQLFMAMFNVHQAEGAVDVTFGTAVSCVLYGLVPFGLAYVEVTYWRLFCTKISPSSSPYDRQTLRLAQGDVKLRLLKWLYGIKDDASTSKL